MVAVASKLGFRFSNSRLIYRFRWYFVSCVVALAVPITLNSFDPYSFPLPQTLLATGLALICWFPAFHYLTGARNHLPIFALVCLSYGYQFAIPVFTNFAVMETLEGPVFLADGEVIAALWLALLGAIAFIAGYFTMIGKTVKSRLPAVNLQLNRKKAFVHCLAVMVLFPFISSLQQLTDDANLQTSSIENLLVNQLLVAIGIMSWLVYSAEEPPLTHRIFLWFLILFQLYIGLASTVLERPLVGLCIVMIFKWSYTKRLPLGIMVGVMGLIFFLQPVKVGVRQDSWYGPPIGAPEKVALWVDRAGLYWWEAITSNKPVSDSTSATFKRSDFIHQFAHIYSLTPSVIPYQYGGTYSFFLVSFIPRIIWPEKPVTNTNTFYGITYGITSKEGAERSNFGISLVGESFINFGVLGVVLVMTLQGAVFGFLESLFAGPKSGAGGQAVFLACSIWFLNGVGSSAEILFGGIIQNLIAGSALLFWARASRPSSHIPIIKR